MFDRDPRDTRPWFAVKSHGFGCGLPICWQGWASLIIFMAIALVLPLVLDPRLAIVLIAVLSAGFVALSKVKSNGVWRWRWGERD